MLDRLLRPIKQSFSAKIVTLVVASVVVTSIVVGFVTTHSTKVFLAAKTSEKFPSVIGATRSKISLWYDHKLSDLIRLSDAPVFLENLAKHINRPPDAPPDSAVINELSKYVSIVQAKFPVYEKLLVLGRDGDVIAGTLRPSDDAADVVWSIINEEGYSVRYSRAIFVPEQLHVHQWLFVPLSVDGHTVAMMAGQINLSEFTKIMRSAKVSAGGELFILDAQGRLLTEPVNATEELLGAVIMQVPTRESGRMRVERHKNYRGREVFRGLGRINETGWWIVYEVDYQHALEPVLNAQTRVWLSVLLVVALFMLAAFKIVDSMMRPVKGLALAARRINDGLVGVKIPKSTDDEIGMMIDTFNEMAKTITLSKAELQYKNKMLNTKNDQLQEMNLKLEELSVTDGLTGLYNHRHFWNILNTELTRVNLYKGDLALVLVDLDDFKRVNDQFGHAVGDLLLQSVAGILRETVRDTDIVARYGGEEFAILLPDTDKKGVENVAEKLRKSVEAMRFKIPETDVTISVTISIGVSVFRGNRRKFFNAADRALYISKSEGKNRVNYETIPS